MNRDAGGLATERMIAAWLVTVVALAIAAPSRAVELFGPHLGMQTGKSPSHAAAADFDGNGVLDFATANSDGHSVTVVLGDKVGGFKSSSHFETPPYPLAIAAGDFNADGAPDLATAHLSYNVLSIFLGDGKGAFGLTEYVGTGGEPVFVEAGDLDFDGDSDLVVANSLDDTISVLMSDGNGSFSESAVIPVGTFPRAIVIHDLSGDGVPDLAVANSWSDSISVLLGDGYGQFDTAAELSSSEGAAPVAMAVDDLDRDGVVDLAVANGGNNSVGVHLGRGGGTFSQAQEFPDVGDSPVWIAAGDFSADGDPDLAVANFRGNTITVLRGNSEGLAAGQDAFGKTEIELDGDPRSILLGDFTANGAMDLLVVLAASDVATILPGDGLGGFGTVDKIPDVPMLTPWWTYNRWPTCLRSGDFDRDGKSDLAVTSQRENAVFLYGGRGDAGFDLFDSADVFDPSCPAVGDFSGDGHLDLAVPVGPPFGGSAIQIVLGDGQGGLSPGQAYPIGPDTDTNWVSAGDFNADGKTDLAATNILSSSVSILLAEEGGGFADPVEVPSGAVPSSLAIADFDSDGDLDLAVADQSGNQVCLHRGDGNGQFAGIIGEVGPALRVNDPEDIAGEYVVRGAAFGPSLWSGAVSGLVEPADDGNGNAYACHDLSNEFDGRIALVDRGYCTFTTKVRKAQAAGASAVIVVDFVPSGLPSMGGSDPMITIPSVGVSGNTGDLLKAALPDLHVTLLFRGADQVVPVGGSPLTVVAGQFDGNEPIDLATANRGGSSVSILAGNGDGTFVETQRIPLGISPASLAVADLNLDGLDDLGFVATANHVLGALINGGDAGFTPTPVFYSGRGPLSVTSADFDGDHVPDLAASNLQSDSIGIFVNRIMERVDPNGSNRVDGFDVADVSRLLGVDRAGEEYRRTHDIDLNGVINGDDLALVASNFGQLIKRASPLRASLLDPLAANPHTITLQPGEQEGDTLTVDVLINDDVHLATAAEFAVTFDTYAGGDEAEELLEVIGYDPGDYFAGGLLQSYEVDSDRPEGVRIRVTRLPDHDRVGSGRQRLVSLILKAKSMGQTTIDFAPVEGRGSPTLLDAAGSEVSGVSFIGGVTARVDASSDEAAGQKIGFSPTPLDFGPVAVGSVSKEGLRLANFGYADLVIEGVGSTIPEFLSFFTSRFTIPPFGSVELPVRFAPSTPGVFAGKLIVYSDDPESPEVRAPLLGRSDLALTVTPEFVDFGITTLGSRVKRRVGIGNRGKIPLLLTDFTISDPAFGANLDFTLLNPGEFREVELEFCPSASGVSHAVLTLSFGYRFRTDAVLSLEGSGRAEP